MVAYLPMSSARDKKRTIRENSERGKEGERQVEKRLRDNCESVEPTGDGSDFYAKGCRNGVKDGYHEVKTGDAQLSDRQKQMKKDNPGRYTVDRV